MEALCDLLFELSNEDRLRILFELDKETLKLSHISKRLDFTVQETSRNIARLVEARLVTRTTDGAYEISPYGVQAIKLLPGYQFLTKNTDYFYKHPLGIPQEFASRIGELIECKPVSQLLDVFTNVERILGEAEEYYVYIGEPLSMSAGITLARDALDRGIKGWGIEPKGYERPAQLIESVPEEVWKEIRAHSIKGNLKNKTLDTFEVTMCMNEKEVAILNFLNPVTGFEYNGFTSTDCNTVKWCKEIFDYYWEKAL